MYTFISVLILIVCILLIMTVLVQNSKGGGLASNFSASNQIMGVKKTTDFLEKFTWGLAATLLILCLAAAMSIDRTTANTNQSQIEQQLQQEETTNQPAFPVQNNNTTEDTKEESKK